MMASLEKGIGKLDCLPEVTGRLVYQVVISHATKIFDM